MNFTKKYIDDIYTDKAFHWLMFLKHKNGYYLRKEALDSDIKEDATTEAFDAYCRINDQIIKEFGKDESFISHLENEQKIALLKLDYIINKKVFSQTLYEIEEAKRDQNTTDKDDKPFDINKEIGILSKFLGGGIINIKEYTIHQYLTAKKLLKDG